MFCKRCGKRIDSAMGTCPHCGRDVDSLSGGNGFWDLVDGGTIGRKAEEVVASGRNPREPGTPESEEQGWRDEAADLSDQLTWMQDEPPRASRADPGRGGRPTRRSVHDPRPQMRLLVIRVAAIACVLLIAVALVLTQCTPKEGDGNPNGSSQSASSEAVSSDETPPLSQSNGENSSVASSSADAQVSNGSTPVGANPNGADQENENQ